MNLECAPDDSGHQESSNQSFAELQPDDILSTVDGLGYRCDGRFLALNSYENRVYRIGIENDDPVVVKFYRPNRWSNAAIVEEHDFTIALAEQEIPVVAPLEIDGATLHHCGNFRLSVCPWRGGRAPELDNHDQMRQLGRLVARIHLHGEISDFVHRPSVDVPSYGYASADYLLGEDLIPGELRASYEAITELLFTNIDDCLDRAGDVRTLRLHADFHPGNVLIAGEQLHIVDFDDARTGPAVQDLWMFLSGDQNEQSPQLEILLEGYEEFRSFDARELNLIEPLRTLRILHYAAWLARRWDDPAFKSAFPWFNTNKYWGEHILALREQAAIMQEPPLAWNAL